MIDKDDLDRWLTTDPANQWGDDDEDWEYDRDDDE